MLEFPSLKINTINANIKISKTDPKMNISGQIGDFKLIKREHKFDIEKRDAEILVHNYPAFSQLDNSKNIMDMASKVAAESMSDSYKAIAEYSSDGDSLMAIERKGGNPIASIAARNYERFLNAEIKLGFFPKNPIQIEVKKGYVSSNYNPGEIETIINKKLNISAEMGKVDIRANYPKVNIEVIGNSIDYKV